VDVGNRSTPTSAGLDEDCDLGLLIGNLDANIGYFQNIGKAANPAVIQRTGDLNPFTGVDVGKYSTPRFIDQDWDGDPDYFSGETYDWIRYYENIGSATNPAFIQRVGSLNPFGTVDVGNTSTTSFADLDGDSDQDAFFGKLDGFMNYFENTMEIWRLNLPLMPP
jgi:hypothetical protein